MMTPDPSTPPRLTHGELRELITWYEGESKWTLTAKQTSRALIELRERRAREQGERGLCIYRGCLRRVEIGHENYCTIHGNQP